MSNATDVIDKIKSFCGDKIIEQHEFRGDLTFTIPKAGILEFFKFLRDDPALEFNFLMDITAVDYLRKKPQRFEVVYHFYSLKYNRRLRIKLPVGMDDSAVDSVIPLWKTANWFEREIWDLYGIKFNGHPNLRRILLYEGFKGHPLRKDYPINKRQPLIGPLN
ncbi:MAG: NADH-quinone oxidoreductase subunit C [Nitrospinota bacterium]|nr:NADH-quinone oxidoreductase subunit C [Nitrospinota bacterium]